MQDKKQLFLKGMHHGIPVARGYLAVSFTLGIAAKRAGFTPIQAMPVSYTHLHLKLNTEHKVI